MYKEKYLKYKTKYLDLKNQLDSNYNIIQDGGKYNIIQDGGCNSAGIKGICDPNMGPVIDKMTHDKIIEQKKLDKNSLENATVKVIDYVKKINCYPTNIIINPTPQFYEKNQIKPYKIDKNILEKEKSFIILKRHIDFCKRKSIVVGLLVNYEEKDKFFVIEYVRDDGLYCKTYQKVINTLNVSTIDIFYYGKQGPRGPNYLATSEFIVNITNLFELFNSCITHIRYDMQEAQQIDQANAEQIIKEINTIIENITNICNKINYKYNLLEIIELGEYIRETS